MRHAPSDRRCKLFYLNCGAMMNALGNWKHYQFVQLPVLRGLPDGYTIRRIGFEMERDSFSLLIHHPSFPDVPDGGTFPAEMAVLETVEIPQRPSPLGSGTETVYGTPAPDLVNRINGGVISFTAEVRGMGRSLSDSRT